MFRALVVDEGQQVSVQELGADRLPEGDVTVTVEYSTVNYKDGLAIVHGKPVIRSYPMVPGIDLAGTVSASEDPRYGVGDRVVLNGWGVGEAHWGGFAGMARVKGDWLVPLPDAFSTEQAMAIGTAGYTAMLTVMALESNGLTPDAGDVLVTGAAGGVGSVAIALLAKLGFRVIALTGRPEEADYLTSLGAAGIIERSELTEPGRALGAERWAGAVDTVGSQILANVLASTSYGGVVAACGLAAGADLPASVMPFIIRGVTLAGVDSVMAPTPVRLAAWERLATDLEPTTLSSIVSTIGLEQLPQAAADILAGAVRGRLVVDVNA